jgi:hypothetical protein
VQNNSTQEAADQSDRVIIAVSVCVPIIVIAAALAGIFGCLHLQKVNRKI